MMLFELCHGSLSLRHRDDCEEKATRSCDNLSCPLEVIALTVTLLKSCVTTVLL